MAAHGTSSRVMVNEGHMSGYISSYSCRHARGYGDVTTLLDTGAKFVPGLLSGGLSLTGPFDSAAAGLYAEVDTVKATDDGLLVTVLPDGFTVGKPAFIAVCDMSGFTVNATVSDRVEMSVEGDAQNGVDWGVSLHGHSAETIDGDGTTVDELASTLNGGVASLHVTALSGFTGVVFKVQDSPDDSVWTDLITFTTVTGVTSERATVSGAVDQYVRVTWDVTGSGSVTFTAAFARR